MAKERKQLIISVSFIGAGATFFLLYAIILRALPALLLYDLIEATGIIVLFTGACMLVHFLVGVTFASRLFYTGIILILLTVIFSVTDEIAREYAMYPFHSGSIARGMVFHVVRSITAIGYTFILCGALFLLYETANLRRKAEIQESASRASSEQRQILNRVLDMAAEAVFGLDRDGHVYSWNLGARKLFLYPDDEAIGLPLDLLLIRPGDSEENDILKEVCKNGVLRDVKVLGRTKACLEFRGEASFTTIPDENGDLLGFSVVVRDKEQQIRNLQQIDSARNLLSNALQALGVGVFIVNADLEILEFNRGMEQLIGYNMDDIHALGFESVLKQCLEPTASALLDETREKVFDAGEHAQFNNVQIIRKDMTRRICSAVISPLEDKTGDVFAAVCAVVDTTERNQLQAQVLSARKMESLGRMAGGIAHDFNNILGAILGYASLICEKVEADSTIREKAEAILGSARRASALTRQLQIFAQGESTHISTVSLSHLVEETLHLFEHELNPRIKLEYSSCGHPLPVDVDTDSIRQVMLNLLVNAYDAIEEQGTISVLTGKGPDISRPGTKDAGDMAWVTIEDSGHGMTPEVHQRLYEPYFTTKPSGYGLGLSIVYGSIEAHKGSIHVESEPGKGTRVRFYLPLSNKPWVPVPDSVSSDTVDTLGDETILVVDDEQLICTLVSDILTTRGYTTLTASDGTEALDLYEAHQHDVALIIMDMVMPGLSGPQTFEKMRQIRADLPCIFSTGYGAEGAKESFAADPLIRFLPKPFEVQQLFSCVHDLLSVR